MTAEISILISLTGAVLSVLTFFIGRMTAAKQNGREAGALSVEIGYIKKEDIAKLIAFRNNPSDESWIGA